MLSMNMEPYMSSLPHVSCLMLRIASLLRPISPSMPSLKTVSSMMPDPTGNDLSFLKYQTIWYISLFSCYSFISILKSCIIPFVVEIGFELWCNLKEYSKEDCLLELLLRVFYNMMSCDLGIRHCHNAKT